MHTGTHHNIATHTALYKELRQHCIVTERVNIIARFTNFTEFFVIIKLAVKCLPCKALATGHIAVRLNPPAVDGNPSAAFNKLSDFVKKLGVYFFNPAIIRSRRAGKNKILIFVKAINCAAESLKYFAASLLPAPKPNRVKMSVSYKMYLIIHYFTSLFKKTVVSAYPIGKCVNITALNAHYAAGALIFKLKWISVIF